MPASNIIYLPIEPIESRYTAQMRRWVERDLNNGRVRHKTVAPYLTATIRIGEFLDVNRTIAYKNQQLAMVAEMFDGGLVQPDTLFLVGDAWFPGIEAIRYMADLQGIRVKIVGWHYAGMADPWDFLTQHAGEWATRYEQLLLEHVFDAVCVGSHFHRDLIYQRFGPAVAARVWPFGLAWNPRDLVPYVVPREEREKIVVFPHRWANEKAPAEFIRVRHELDAYSDWRWVVSSGRPLAPSAVSTIQAEGIEVVVHKSKADYYRFLARCGVWFSAARQETFGYALHEAIALGIPIVAPRRCCYPEMLPACFIFDDDQLAFGVRSMMRDPIWPDSDLAWGYESAAREFIARAVAL